MSKWLYGDSLHITLSSAASEGGARSDAQSGILHVRNDSTPHRRRRRAKHDSISPDIISSVLKNCN
jgi:hypothetical protein